jgi:hypothetical protein
MPMNVNKTQQQPRYPRDILASGITTISDKMRSVDTRLIAAVIISYIYMEFIILKTFKCLRFPKVTQIFYLVYCFF